MKIMISNGIPKRDASDTMHMTRAFADCMDGTVGTNRLAYDPREYLRKARKRKKKPVSYIEVFSV